MHEWMESAIRIGALAGQFIFSAIAFYALLQMAPRRTARWRHLSLLQWRTKEISGKRLRMFLLSREHPRFKERELLLASCGVTADPAWYSVARRLLQLAVVMLLSVYAGFAAWKPGSMPLSLLIAVVLPIGMLLLMDIALLRAWSRIRAIRMTREIFIVSSQLLYLADSSLNIHAKLSRCVPFTQLMRPDLERLLAEWYYDAGQALQRFKKRLGTEDALTFVETIDALREHESGDYYELLQARIDDYKEKLELAKDSRKESLSYGLFIMAGVPILYTFQVFIYPWVSEGQKLLQSLG